MSFEYAKYTRNGEDYTEPSLILLADIDDHPHLPPEIKTLCRDMYIRQRLTISLFVGNMELAYRRGWSAGKDSGAEQGK